MTKNLSVEEAAVAIGVSPYTVRAWLRDRRLGYIRAGRRVLVPESEVRRFLREGTVPAVPAAPRPAGQAS